MCDDPMILRVIAETFYTWVRQWNGTHVGTQACSVLQHSSAVDSSPRQHLFVRGEGTNQSYIPVLRPQTRTGVPYRIALAYFKTKYSHSKTGVSWHHRSHLTSPLLAYPVALETRVCSRDKLGEG